MENLRSQLDRDRDEAIEGREHAVRVITELNRLKDAAGRYPEPTPEQLDQIRTLEATLTVWKQLLAMRELELQARALEMRAGSISADQRQEVRELIQARNQAIEEAREAFPFSRGMTPELQALTSREFVELFNREKEILHARLEEIDVHFKSEVEKLKD